MASQIVETQVFHECDLEVHVPAKHVLREIDRFLEFGAAIRR